MKRSRKYVWMTAGPVTLDQFESLRLYIPDAQWCPKVFDGFSAIIVVNEGDYPDFDGVEDVFFIPYGVSGMRTKPNNDWERMAYKLLEVVYGRK